MILDLVQSNQANAKFCKIQTKGDITNNCIEMESIEAKASVHIISVKIISLNLWFIVCANANVQMQDKLCICNLQNCV